MAKSSSSNYYCVCVRRDYESVWRFISKHNSLEEAQAELEKRRSYTGALNYDNAELRILSRAEAKAEFGRNWEYKPIGTSPQQKSSKTG